MAMPIYRILSPVKSGGKRHMPGDSLDLSEKAGKDLARIGAVFDPTSSGPMVPPIGSQTPTGTTIPGGPPTTTPGQIPQQPPVNQPPRTTSTANAAAKQSAQKSTAKKSK